MNSTLFRLCCLAVLPLGTIFALAQELTRLRARDMGVPIGGLPTGPLNTITDGSGVDSAAVGGHVDF